MWLCTCDALKGMSTTSFLLPVPKLWDILYSHSRINLKADQASCLGDLRNNIMEILLLFSYFGMRRTHETHTNVFQYANRMEKNKSEKELPTRIQVVFQAATICEVTLTLVTRLHFHRWREDSDSNQKQEIKFMWMKMVICCFHEQLLL